MNNRLFCNRDMDDVEVFGCSGGSVAVYSRRGPEKTQNEDSASASEIDSENCVLTVADGLGGLPDGDRASRFVIETMSTYIHSNTTGDHGTETIDQRITDAISQSNQSLLDSGKDSATTVAVAAVNGNQLNCFLIGDSSICLVGQRGKIKYQNVPHSPVSQALDAEVIDEQEALLHPHRNVVSNVVGSAEMYVEASDRIKIAPRDTLIVSSDGVFDNLYLAEIIEIIRKGPLLDAARNLRDKTFERMNQWPPHDTPAHPDDTTFILFRLKN